jgi:hypothetical protein
VLSFRAETLAFAFANDKVSRCEHDDSECFTETALNDSASNEMQAQVFAGVDLLWPLLTQSRIR